MSAHHRMTSIFRTSSSIIGRFEDALRQRRSARTLEALPDYILKDIGYARDSYGIPSRASTELSR